LDAVNNGTSFCASTDKQEISRRLVRKVFVDIMNCEVIELENLGSPKEKEF
jgi:hypothetical protein